MRADVTEDKRYLKGQGLRHKEKTGGRNYNQTSLTLSSSGNNCSIIVTP